MENWRRFMSESEQCKTNTSCSCVDSSINISIKQVQNFLADKYGKENMPNTFKTGEADGACGPETQEMIEKFQEENGLKCDGCVGPETGPAMFPELASDEQESEEISGSKSSVSVSGRAMPSQEVIDKLFTLTKAEVGGQGEDAITAFMETVFNRAAIYEKSIDKVVSNDKYYEPINTKGGGSIEGLMRNPKYILNDAQIELYSNILQQVISGSNITDGATHNSSAGVATSVRKGGYDSVVDSIREIGSPPETFYSKTFEQKRIASLQKRKTTKISVSV
jgi:hypothetical protein